VDNHPGGCRAALAGGAEAAPQATFERQLQSRVIHHDDDVLAAHLEMHFLETRRGAQRDGSADVGRSGE
jgi:hypothetical protein